MSRSSIMNTIIQYQNQLESKYNTRLEQNKIRLQQALADPKRHIPSIETMAKYRNRLAFIGFSILIIPVVQLFWLQPGSWMYDDPYYDVLFNLPGAACLIILMFSGMFHYVIEKRNGLNL